MLQAPVAAGLCKGHGSVAQVVGADASVGGRCCSRMRLLMLPWSIDCAAGGCYKPPPPEPQSTTIGVASPFRWCFHGRAPKLQSNTAGPARAFRQSPHRLEPELQGTIASASNAFRESYHRRALGLQATSGKQRAASSATICRRVTTLAAATVAVSGATVVDGSSSRRPGSGDAVFFGDPVFRRWGTPARILW
jgi:hypothetical protein